MEEDPLSTVLRDAVDLLEKLVEGAGALIVFIGALWAFTQFLTAGVRDRGQVRDFTRIRLSLGRFLALGLEFQLAGDVLRTAIAPSWTQIGQLAAIATIRTALNYFLSREIAEERAQVQQAQAKHMRDVPDLSDPTSAA